MAERTGELAVVVLHDEGDAGWQPAQVFTRSWQKFSDGSEGWRYELFDGAWCRRDERLHLTSAGGGGLPYINGPFVEPGVQARLWTLPGQAVVDGWNHRDADGNPRPLTEEEILAMGYERTTEHPGDVFSGASDERTEWCEQCEDNIPKFANQCEHIITCWSCGETYWSEGDEEDRCPQCKASQHECDHCGDLGAETCISCGQWICKGCWPDHDDDTPDGKCERGRPDWKEPGACPPSHRAAQREHRRRRARLRKRRGWA